MLFRHMFFKDYSPRILFILLICCVFQSKISHAQGDLLIYPKRVVFEGPIRSQDLNLANTGKDTARYLLSVIQIRMKEDGSFESITEPDPGQNFADKYFRIFPRNVVLPPNEAQTVKVQLYNTGELIPGEYRSHLYVRAEAQKSPLGEVEPETDSTSLSIKLVAVFGISIPVIIRTGDNTTGITISDLSLEKTDKNEATIKFNCNRSGNMSAYGDFTVNYISPEGKTIKVGSANGMAIYAPITKRIFNLPITPLPGVDLQKGSLQVVYSYGSTKDEKMAKENLVLR